MLTTPDIDKSVSKLIMAGMNENPTKESPVISVIGGSWQIFAIWQII